MRAWLAARWMLVLAISVFAGCGDDDDGAAATRLRILVTNDDGFGAAGIDALVEGLLSDAGNEVVVSAPDGNRSGSSDMIGPSQRCGDLGVSAAQTRSGFAATAINGCPADAVTYALRELYPVAAPPHVVIAGVNEGQNVSRVVATQVSGTVGAAKTAARNGIPALAASQGLVEAGHEPDYAAGVEAVLTWLSDNRAALLAGSAPAVDSLNIPSCASGAIRGTLTDLPLAEEFDEALSTQRCDSTLSDPQSDVEAFNNGYTTLNRVPFD